jgi:hypothetical protein
VLLNSQIRAWLADKTPNAYPDGRTEFKVAERRPQRRRRRFAIIDDGMIEC